MPSFRDLKGREVDDVVDSRTFPTLPTPGAEAVERGEIKAAMEKAAANRPRRERNNRVGVPTESHDPPSEAFLLDQERWRREQATPLPEDFESGLAALEATLDTLDALADEVADATRRAREQMAALRARAQQDADKVAKFSAALKLLQQADT